MLTENSRPVSKEMVTGHRGTALVTLLNAWLVQGGCHTAAQHKLIEMQSILSLQEINYPISVERMKSTWNQHIWTT